MAPIHLLQRLKAYYSKQPQEKPPAISSKSAAVLSILFTIIYVAPFYLSKTTRPSPQLSRDAPSVIRARIRAVTCSTIVSSLITAWVVVKYANADIAETLRLLGWWPVNPLDIAKVLLLVMILFIGPLFEAGIAEGSWREWVRGARVTEVLGSWMGYRNLVAGPITEEIVFRGLFVPLHLLAKVSVKKVIFTTPLYFGIAHVHHFYEYKLTHPHTPVLPALVRSLFQFTYTSIFGFFATFVYIRTGSIYTVIVAHTFCNWAGLPRLWGKVEAGIPIGPPVGGRVGVAGRGKEDGDRQPEPGADASSLQVADGRLAIGWTITYYCLLVAGAFAFARCLWPLTESKNALALV